MRPFDLGIMTLRVNSLKNISNIFSIRILLRITVIVSEKNKKTDTSHTKRKVCGVFL